MKIKLGLIRADLNLQCRASTDPAVVECYRQKLFDDSDFDFPDAVVFFDGENYWLADGFQRHAAYLKTARVEMPCRVEHGSRRDAMLYATGANEEHGCRRTNADRRKAVLTLLGDPEWRERSDHWIAEKCKVAQSFVSGLRSQLISEISCPNGSEESTSAHIQENSYIRTGRDGRTRDTSNIGRKKTSKEASKKGRPRKEQPVVASQAPASSAEAVVLTASASALEMLRLYWGMATEEERRIFCTEVVNQSATGTETTGGVA